MSSDGAHAEHRAEHLMGRHGKYGRCTRAWGSTSQPWTRGIPSRSKMATSSVNSNLSMSVNRTLTSTPVACNHRGISNNRSRRRNAHRARCSCSRRCNSLRLPTTGDACNVGLLLINTHAVRARVTPVATHILNQCPLEVAREAAQNTSKHLKRAPQTRPAAAKCQVA